MALELNGTTGVSLVQDGVVTAADLASGAITSAALPAGSVVGFAKTKYEFPADAGTSSTSYVEVSSNLRLTYTPQSTSNTLIVTVQFSDSIVQGNTQSLEVSVLDVSDSSHIWNGATPLMYRVISYDDVKVDHVHGATRTVNAWSGSKTISIYVKTNSGTAYWNWAGSNGTADLMVMEIAG
jgi:hypothetical protein